MRPEQRQALRELYQFRCGYCGVSESDAGAELTVDHFQPTARNGAHEPGNWVYACFFCNNAKSDYWQPDSPQRILHPLRDNLAEHIIEQEDGTLLGLTETGKFHIERLQLNRPPLVAHRLAHCEQEILRQRVAGMRQDITALRQRLAAVEQEMDELRQRYEW